MRTDHQRVLDLLGAKAIGKRDGALDVFGVAELVHELVVLDARLRHVDKLEPAALLVFLVVAALALLDKPGLLQDLHRRLGQEGQGGDVVQCVGYRRTMRR